MGYFDEQGIESRLSVRSEYHMMSQTSVFVSRCGSLAFLPSKKRKAGMALAKSNYQQFSDEQLMEAYRDDDMQAFDILFNRYKNILYRYLVRQSGNPSLAEEMFQEVWAGLIKHRKKYTVQAKFKTYLFHIAHNKLIDFYRANSRTDAVSYDDEEQSVNEKIEQVNDPEHQADVLGKLDVLVRELEKLPAAQRDVFLLHEEAGFTLAEVAQTMNVSRNTVKSRLRYALQRLRRSMERYT